jgi:hypothetical protein
LVANHPGEHKTESQYDAEGAPAIVVFSYPGRTQADAAILFQEHAGRLAKDGYTPVAQSWGEGRAGLGRVFAIGEYANTLRPKGFLTVTY